LTEFARGLFLQMDTDRSGQLEYHELQNFVTAFFSSLGTSPPPVSDIHTMFQKYDTDKSGRLSFDESMALAKDILNILLSKAKTATAGPPPPA
jgi:Ca2+-binding EF-hand superfamily protein